MAHQGRRNADQSLILALACGATIENAARQAGVSDTTVQRRLKEPEFLAKVQDAKQEMVERTARMLTAAALESVKTLLDLQSKDQPPSVRHSAARTIIEFGVKLRENAELFARVAVLEAQLATSA
jgi:Bacterial regulatory proteins, lacI family